MSRANRFRVTPGPVRRFLYGRRGFFWFWTLVGNVRHGPAHELRALRIYMRANAPAHSPTRWLLVPLTRLYLRTAPEDEGEPHLLRKVLAKEETAASLIHDTTGYEGPPSTALSFVPGLRRHASGSGDDKLD